MPVPSLKRAKQALEEGETEQRFWEEHLAAFLEAYPEQFVAVREGEVISATEDLQELLQLVRSMGIEPDDIWISFVTANPDFLLL